MKVTNTDIPEVLIIEPDIFGDHRGWFVESYTEERYHKIGLTNIFVQDNHSFTREKGTIRGLHFQINPMAQAKLVRCSRGEIYDVVVDLRKGSPTYKRWTGITISEENQWQIYVPKGFAHGFVTLTDDVEVQYKVDEYYSKENDRSIRFDDPELNIEWGITNPILSDKDANASLLAISDANFIYHRK